MWSGFTKRGKKVCLLNPNEKGKKYCAELKSGNRQTNDGSPKVDTTGKLVKLTKEGRAFRSGYLQARKDSAKAYKAKQKKQSNK